MTVEEMSALLAEHFPDNNWPATMSLDGDTLTLTYEPDERHVRPGGTVNGPTMMGLADHAAYLVILAHVGPQLLAVTTSLHIDFLRKPAVRTIVVRAQLIKLGRRLAVVDVRITSGDDPALVAKAQVTYSLPVR